MVEDVGEALRLPQLGDEFKVANKNHFLQCPSALIVPVAIKLSKHSLGSGPIDFRLWA